MRALKNKKTASSATATSTRRINIPKIQHDVPLPLSQEEQHEKIARKAYELFERRGCEHGCDLQDWFEAEKIIKAAWIN